MGVYVDPGNGLTHIYVCLLPCFPLHFAYHHRQRTSDLRRAYKPWRIKKDLENIEGEE